MLNSSAVFNEINSSNFTTYKNSVRFEQSLIDVGLRDIPAIHVKPGKFQRFGKDKKYSILYNGDFGYFKDWSGEISEFCWFADSTRTSLTPEERKKIDSQMAAEKKLRDTLHERASIRASDIFLTLSGTGKSKYLARKKLTSVEGIKFGSDRHGDFIATTLEDNFGKIWSLQFIYDEIPSGRDTNKSFLFGGKKSGFYAKFGNHDSGTVYICEGVATGLSILLAQPNSLVIAAYDCGNLAPVVQNIAVKYSDRKIIVAGDNDLTKPHNIGKEKAEEVAKNFGLEIVLPNFKSTATKPSDFNDLHQMEGIDEVKKQLESITAAAKNGLKVVSIKDFLSTELAPREYIVEPIFPKQGLMMIFAKRGIGKTFFALHLACSIAGGFNIFDRWKISKPRRVLYIDGEMPANTMQERLAVLIAGLPHDAFDESNLQIITPDFQTENFGQMPDLSMEAGQKQIEEIIAAKKIDVIVIDNLSTLCRTGKENESESWNSTSQWVLKLRTQGKSIIFIHHAGKNDSQRGNSKKEDILDTVIKLKRPDDYESSQGARFEVHFEKSRGFAGKDADPFEITLQLDGTKAIWQLAEIEDVESKRVLELHQEGLSQRDIGDELGISASKVNRILKKVKEERK